MERKVYGLLLKEVQTPSFAEIPELETHLRHLPTCLKPIFLFVYYILVDVSMVNVTYVTQTTSGNIHVTLILSYLQNVRNLHEYYSTLRDN